MRKLFSRLSILSALLVLCCVPAQASMYRLQYDGSVFDVDAWVTTNTQEDAIAITGTMVDTYGHESTITGLVPTSSPSYHDRWLWNNKFTANAPHVDWYGLLWSTDDGIIANYYIDNGKFILSVINYTKNNYDHWASGDVGLTAVTAVPLPGAGLLFGFSLAGIGILRQRKLNAKLA